MAHLANPFNTAEKSSSSGQVANMKVKMLKICELSLLVMNRTRVVNVIAIINLFFSLSKFEFLIDIDSIGLDEVLQRI
jgi:hypothetical protein